MNSTQLRDEIRSQKGGSLLPANFKRNSNQELLTKPLPIIPPKKTIIIKPPSKPKPNYVIPKSYIPKGELPVAPVANPKFPEPPSGIKVLQPTSFIPSGELDKKMVRPSRKKDFRFKLPPTSTTSNPFRWSLNPTTRDLAEEFIPEFLPELGELAMGFL